jgi:hypothetical protein
VEVIDALRVPEEDAVPVSLPDCVPLGDCVWLFDGEELPVCDCEGDAVDVAVDVWDRDWLDVAEGVIVCDCVCVCEGLHCVFCAVSKNPA